MPNAATRSCPRCNAAASGRDRFCHACGAALNGCTRCGSPVEAGDRFCHACGSPLVAATTVAPTRPPLPFPPTGKPRGLVRSVWGDAWRAYGRHFHHLIPTALVVESFAVTFELVWYEILGGRSIWLLLFLGPGAVYLVYFVLAGIHVIEIAEIDSGAPARGLMHTLREARPRLPVLVAVGLFIWFVIDIPYFFVFLLAIHIGSPGIAAAVVLPSLLAFLVLLTWFMTRSACFSQVLILEDLGPRAALKRSWELTKGGFWRLYLIVATTGIVTGVVQIVLEAVVAPYAYGSSPDARRMTELGPTDAGGFFGAVVTGSLTVTFGLLVGVFIYIHLRRRWDEGRLAALPASAPAWSLPAQAG